MTKNQPIPAYGVYGESEILINPKSKLNYHMKQELVDEIWREVVLFSVDSLRYAVWWDVP